MCTNRVSVSGWSPASVNVLYKFEHPMSMPHYFSLPLILSMIKKNVFVYVFLIHSKLMMSDYCIVDGFRKL